MLHQAFNIHIADLNHGLQKNGSHIISQTPFSIIHHLSVIIRDAKVLGCQDGC